MNPSEAILNAFQKDESGAFRLLFDRYYDNLLLYCYHILNDLEAAEDIVQDCFFCLWNSKRLNSFTGDLDRFIFKMVKNRSFLFWKKIKKDMTFILSLHKKKRHYFMIPPWRISKKSNCCITRLTDFPINAGKYFSWYARTTKLTRRLLMSWEQVSIPWKLRWKRLSSSYVKISRKNSSLLFYFF